MHGFNTLAPRPTTSPTSPPRFAGLDVPGPQLLHKSAHGRTRRAPSHGEHRICLVANSQVCGLSGKALFKIREMFDLSTDFRYSTRSHRRHPPQCALHTWSSMLSGKTSTHFWTYCESQAILSVRVLSCSDGVAIVQLARHMTTGPASGSANESRP